MANQGFSYDDANILSDLNNDALTMAQVAPLHVGGVGQIQRAEILPFRQPSAASDATKVALPLPTDKYYGGAGPNRAAFDEMKGNAYDAVTGQSTRGQALADSADAVDANPRSPQSVAYTKKNLITGPDPVSGVGNTPLSSDYMLGDKIRQKNYANIRKENAASSLGAKKKYGKDLVAKAVADTVDQSEGVKGALLKAANQPGATPATLLGAADTYTQQQVDAHNKAVMTKAKIAAKKTADSLSRLALPSGAKDK